MKTNGKIFNIKTIGALIIVLLIVLVFFSNTIYSFNQPTVTAVSPKNGKLKNSEIVSGTADWADTADVYSQVAGTVDEILVRDGDKVIKGQDIIRMKYDIDELQKKIDENDISRSKLNVDIQNINLKIQKINKNIIDLKNENYNADFVSEYEIKNTEADIEKNEGDFENLKKLYDAGAIPKTDIDKAEFEISSLKSKLEDLKSKKEENERKSSDEIEEKEKARKKQLTEYEYELASLSEDLKSKQLDIDNYALQDESYRKSINEFGENTVIKSPADGIITSISVKNGQYIPEHQLMVSFGVGNEFKIECDVSQDNNFIAVGEEYNITNSKHRLKAKVTKITPEKQSKTITLSVCIDDVLAGETFEAVFEKESETSYTLVPNGGVNKDKDGFFVYQIQRRDGIMGKEYYSKKVRVTTGNSDNENTAILKGINFFEPIALLSDKSFEENQTIKVKNESDFFED